MPRFHSSAGAGEYPMVVNAAGWGPMAEVFEFDNPALHQNFLFRDRLEIRGTVTDGGAPVACAVVPLHEAGAGHVCTTGTKYGGGYAFPLPLAGRYLVTALHPLTHVAMAQKPAVDNRSMTLNFATPSIQEVTGERVEA